MSFEGDVCFSPLRLNLYQSPLPDGHFWICCCVSSPLIESFQGIFDIKIESFTPLQFFSSPLIISSIFSGLQSLHAAFMVLHRQNYAILFSFILELMKFGLMCRSMQQNLLPLPMRELIVLVVDSSRFSVLRKLPLIINRHHFNRTLSIENLIYFDNAQVRHCIVLETDS